MQQVHRFILDGENYPRDAIAEACSHFPQVAPQMSDQWQPEGPAKLNRLDIAAYFPSRLFNLLKKGEYRL